MARNSAGSAISSWSQTTTGESIPEGVRPIQAEPRDTGRSILLRWLPPGVSSDFFSTFVITARLEQKNVFRNWYII